MTTDINQTLKKTGVCQLRHCNQHVPGEALLHKNLVPLGSAKLSRYTRILARSSRTFVMQPWLRLLIMCLSLAGVIPLTQASLQEKSPVRSTLISSVTATGSQETVLLGVRFELQPGWKLYAPPPLFQEDAASRHPVFDWSGSQNLEKVHLHWPPAQPLSSETSPLKGYTRSFILPFTVNLTKPGEALKIRGRVSMIACHIQCVPVTQELSLDLPQGVATPTPEAEQVLKARLPKDSQASQASSSLGWILFVAFIGGVILNFMPCVLPVLSLKLRSFTATKGTVTVSLRSKSFASFGGIVVSFLGLAGVAILVERSGEMFGWGFHFQSPPFLIFMLVLLLFFAKSLWKGSPLDLPPFLNQKLHSLLGSKARERQVLLENFLSGMFATLLATPCTAPFLGTALAYALSRGPFEIILLFTTMGIGFALPYGLLCLMPASKVRLPKPGLWMERLSQVFAVLLLGTAVWIGWVLSQFFGLMLTLFSAVGVAGLIFAMPEKKSLTRNSKGLFITYRLAILALLAPLLLKAPRSQQPLQEEGWEIFDAEKIPHLVQAGKTVFVDITATWCLTCQANKTLVLKTKPVLKALSGEHIIKMRGDWTRPNSHIKAYLHGFNRYGIPFNIVYGPQHPEGLLLPELLTQVAVLKALKQARGEKTDPKGK